MNESRTKIIATVGPASSAKETLRKMILSGVDVFRLNFSHGEHESHQSVIKKIKELRAEMQLNIAILADLQGPKIRTSNTPSNGIGLKEGAELSLYEGMEECSQDKIYITYSGLTKDLKAGEDVLIDDGKIKLKIIATEKDHLQAKVVFGGVLTSRKGVNLPDTKVSIPSLTEKDLKDLDFILNEGVDWVALSFVRSVTDVVELKEHIKRKKKHVLVVSKIEKPEALSELDNIIDVSDAVMVARGDLGVEVSFEKIPLIQKSIVEKCILASKPVVIATQMMESMIENFRPTRAEANDVGNAVLDGADTLMLSGETSVGKFPVGVIDSMHKIIQYTEENAYHFYREHAPQEFDRTFISDSVCYTACKMAQQSKARAIVVFTSSGNTAFNIAAFRPQADIYVFTPNTDLLSRMAILWGVKVYYFDKFTDIDKAIEQTIGILMHSRKLSPDDLVIHVGSTPLQNKGRANMLKLSYV